MYSNYNQWFLNLRPDFRLDRVCSKILYKYQLLNFLLKYNFSRRHIFAFSNCTGKIAKIRFSQKFLVIRYSCVFLVTRPFTWYQDFLPCGIDLEVWPTFKNLSITFKAEEIGLSYCICVFPVTRLFTWYNNFLPWPWCLTYFWKTLNLAITFKPEEMGFHIAHLYLLWRSLSHSTIIFMPPDRMIGGILFLYCFLSCLFVCLFVCLSVCLSVCCQL